MDIKVFYSAFGAAQVSLKELHAAPEPQVGDPWPMIW